jgi:D-alanyl-D-alanine carboxypeptidase
MLLNILLSLFVIPLLGGNYFNFDGFLNLQKENISNQIIENQAPKRIYTDYLDVKTSAQSAIAVDDKSGKILYKKNLQGVRSIGSITKLMTALVFLDHNPGWQNNFSIKNSDRRSGGIIYINTGEILTIKDLFYEGLVVSDNDAIMALVRSTGLSEDDFVKLMNERAEQMGLTDTHFTDPTGLDAGNKSTVGNLARLLNLALQNQAIAKATNLAEYEFDVRWLQNGVEKTRTVKVKNTDLLLKSYLNIIGGKTGHVEEAGYCLATKIKGEGGQEIVIVVLGSDNNFDRFQDVKAIADWVFSNYQWQ